MKGIMIKIGKLTDYAIAILAQMFMEGQGVSRSAHHLSKATGVPEPTVAKILKKLARKNLVSSVRGAAGGYKLLRGADQISVSEIITAMDGPIAIVSCVDGNEDPCKAQALCPVKGNWGRINQALQHVLEDIKLSQMTVSSCGKPYDFTLQPPPCKVTG